ncbi:hypothetical protein Ga0074115_101163 [endosymbiont of Ridgeia piscesae]|uniref:Uncharacterized protein n=1 Tax=endosymbiont of Ridgeia piscesae TaxID=54398 RepID=A0A0T5YTB6_9GAMM|nr:hypothetical protein [endosymbiont of Ridgeia piscesae]KRT53828.1 hypothetical protein Ga0074115_101163 [endosymbiont of Ridgeia piscesae]
MIRTILLFLLTFLILHGCQEGEQIDLSNLPAEEQQVLTALAWLKGADAERDAQQAFARGDLRLLAMATRGASMPGIPTELASKAKSVCGIRYLEGSTDAVVSDMHLKLLQKAEKYAATYNGIMLQHCMK